MTIEADRRQLTCEDRVDKELEGTLDTLKELWYAYTHSDEKCPDCEGDGYIYEACEWCDGEGTFHDYCSACNGTGAVEDDEVCLECDGEGSFWDDCDHCGGDGDFSIQCEKCDGNGVLYPDGEHPELGRFNEYGLSFDYVAPYTWEDQPEGYFRYQLSWGGPSDEFRIYASKVREYRWIPYRIEYWFLDWFDGAHRILSGTDLELLEQIFENFVEIGSADFAFDQAMEDY